MDETLREKIALFRYGVIGELVSRPLAPREKEKLLAAIAAKTWTVPGSQRTQIGRTTVRDWIELYQRSGFDGLKPSPRADTGKPRAIPEPVQELLLALRAERPGASLDSLIRAVTLAGKVDKTVRLSRSSVHRFFASQAPQAPAATSGGEPDALAFTHPHVNDLWTSDLMHGPRLLVPGRRDGGKTYLYAFLDDASRMVPFAAFYLAENAACFKDLRHPQCRPDSLPAPPAARSRQDRALLPPRPPELSAPPHRRDSARPSLAEPRLLGLA
jgi:putative transposase